VTRILEQDVTEDGDRRAKKKRKLCAGSAMSI